MSTENDITHLHATFCDLTGRAEKLRFCVNDWGVILRQEEYRYDAALVERDMRLLVAYLLAAIRDEKRNLGALKLINFLQPDKWFSDLAEAEAQAKTLKERKQNGNNHGTRGNGGSPANNLSANSRSTDDY